MCNFAEQVLGRDDEGIYINTCGVNVDLIVISGVLQLGSRLRMHVSYAIQEKDQPLRVIIYLNSQEGIECADVRTLKQL